MNNTFLSPTFNKQNIYQKVYSKKVVLSNNNIKLNILISKDLGKTYKMTYMINIYPPRNIDPNIKMVERNIDMVSLRKAIMNSLCKYDQNYMKIDRFDTRKVVFVFDNEKWMKDATNSLQSKKSISKFSREFKLKVAPPRMIMMDAMRNDFGKYILRQFKKYVEDKKKGKEFFRFLLPKTTTMKLTKYITNMFDWNYDIQWNTITATLKTAWILTILYSANKVINRSDKEKFFKMNVNKKLSNFDKLRFQKYISKNKIF